MPSVPTAEFSEIAVTIPGSAIGRTRRNETVFRPKNWNRWTASPSLRWAPRGHSITVGDALYQEVTYTRFEAGSADAARFMEIPDAVQARRRTPDGPIVPPAGPATGEVAPGVHVVRVRGYLAMFVEFRDFVLAVEAPESYFGLETIPGEIVSPNGSCGNPWSDPS